jgi:mono/diheme cytochrome c family protein
LIPDACVHQGRLIGTRTSSSSLPGHRKPLAYLLRLVLLGVLLLTAREIAESQTAQQAQPAGNDATSKSAQQLFVKYCASCHGTDGKGNGPAATALNPPPPDLTTLAQRHHGKYSPGYVGALLKFGRSLAAHGSEDMPVWGLRFRELDPVHDPTGQQHIDEMVAYIQSLQVK